MSSSSFKYYKIWICWATGNTYLKATTKHKIHILLQSSLKSGVLWSALDPNPWCGLSSFKVSPRIQSPVSTSWMNSWGVEVWLQHPLPHGGEEMQKHLLLSHQLLCDKSTAPGCAPRGKCVWPPSGGSRSTYPLFRDSTELLSPPQLLIWTMQTQH